MMMKIKYNLKKILLEEDELDVVDTSFFSKYDKVPEWGDYDNAPDPKWEEYHDDLHNHIKSRLTDYVKNNPDVTLEYLKHFNKFQKPIILPQEGHGDQMVDHYISTRFLNPHKIGNHIENSRADTWIEDFHMWLGGM